MRFAFVQSSSHENNKRISFDANSFTLRSIRLQIETYISRNLFSNSSSHFRSFRTAIFIQSIIIILLLFRSLINNYTSTMYAILIM